MQAYRPRTGSVPQGLLQPIADGVKLLLKIIIPTKSNTLIFLIAPGWRLPRHWPVGRWSVQRYAGAGQRRCQPALCDGDLVDGRLWHHPSPAGPRTRSTPSSARCAPCGADGVLRNRDGLRAGRRADGVGQLNLVDIVMYSEPGPVCRPRPGHPVVELAAAAPDVHRLRLGRCRDQPRRSTWSRVNLNRCRFHAEYSAWRSRCSSSPNTRT